MEKALLVGVNLNDGEDYLLSLEELGALAEACDADVIIFDNSLSPMQLRNLQERLEKPIMDRSTLILDRHTEKRNCIIYPIISLTLSRNFTCSISQVTIVHFTYWISFKEMKCLRVVSSLSSIFPFPSFL